jgi:hypothetical protein
MRACPECSRGDVFAAEAAPTKKAVFLYQSGRKVLRFRQIRKNIMLLFEIGSGI